ncbi:cell division protein FtsK [Actinosynnema pretiosum]|uniref:Cell division protein FtsK n=1 Tax=Actinosynnema pretiosum TaxID=42197 RepID=A0A290YZC8_9PSEU|nr:cell division protein FtsK [Actinosynnema pretiosum]ATE52112.1 cell division protein FtsK [Actinosynnema pretiosum]
MAGEIIPLFPNAAPLAPADEPGPVTPAPAAGPVQPAEPVLDGELVDEVEYQRGKARRLAEQAVSKLPARWQSAESAKQAGAALAARAALAPVRYPAAVGRGLVVSARAWWSWVRVEDFYSAAKSSDSLANRWAEIAAVRHRRGVITLAGAGTTGLAGLVTELTAGSLPLLVTGGAVSVALAVTGRRKDGSPGRQAVLGGARSLAMLMDGDNLVEAFRAAGAIGKAESLYFVERPRRDDTGWSFTLDLPPSRKASDVLGKREALASALAVDEVRLILERVRGDKGHAGRLAVWLGHADPYAADPLPWPLAEAKSWDFWQATPFGTSARGQRVDLPLVWTSLLTGAIPRMGKTFTARIPATAAALDPFVLLIVFDGKGGKDWRAFEQVAHRFGRGDDDETCTRLLATLRECAADVARRFDVLGELDDDLCPESKVTPQITRDPALNMPLVLINVDEVQVYLEDETPVQVGVDAKGNPKFKPRGRIVCDLLTYVAKKGPAAGYMLNLATQKPDAQVIPDRLRGQLGTRFALKTMTWQASETILGAGTYKAGMDSSKLLKSHKGVGLLLGADGETELESSEAVIVRTFKLDIREIRAACERGRALREAAGTLSGDAAGNRLIGDVDDELTARISAETDHPDDEPVDAELVELPEVLELLADVLGDEEHGVVPTGELAARLDWTPKRLGEELRAAGVPSAGKRRVEGHPNPVAVVDVDAIRAALGD